MLICKQGISRHVTGTAFVLAAIIGCSGSSSSSGSGVGGAAMGGAIASGGTTGSVALGGSIATAGSLSVGGKVSQGGSPAVGGANVGGANVGGANTGGVQSSGGAVVTGGNSSGGAVPTGGNKAAGGSTTLGSSIAMGGKASGGTPAAGGTSAIASGGGSMGGSSTGKSSGGATTGGKSTGGSTSGGSTSGGGPSACPSAILKSGDSTKTLTVDGISREYILHVPTAYTGTSAVPLVLDFHPIGGSDTQWRSGSPYPAVIDKEGVISVFPNGKTGPMGNAWNVLGCCVSKVNGADVDDVAFAKALVTEIEKTACIDPKRVYAVGFSMGGGMSNYLACHASDVFAAVGPASFDLTQQNEPTCTPSRPITVIEWRGKNDTVVPYAGGHSALVTGMAIDFLGAVGTFQKWASKDGCTGSAGAADSNNCQTYTQCSAGVQVTLCTNNSGGHEAANASVVWPMLKKYTLP